jgi:hypothetical protein
MFPPKKKTQSSTPKLASMNVGRFSGYDRKKEPSVPKVKSQTRREANQANKELNKQLGIQSARQVRQESRQKDRAYKKDVKEIQKANAPKKQRGIDLSIFDKKAPKGKPTPYKAPRVKHSRSCKNVIRMGK